MSKRKRNHPRQEGDGHAQEARVGADAGAQADDAAPSADLPPPETQRERWVKYGSNVVLVSVVVIVLAGLLIFLAQRAHARIDTTATKVHSLKPQSLAVLRNLDQPVKLVSLYTKPDAEQTTTGQPAPDYIGPVNDLLDEYKRNSSKIEVDIIDPVKQPTKVDDLINEVTEKYGGEIRKYKDFLKSWPDELKTIKGMAELESAQAVQLEGPADANSESGLSLAAQSIVRVTKDLENLQSRIDQRLKQRPPDYKGATDAIRDRMDDLSSMLGQMITSFESVPGMAPRTQPTTAPSSQPTTGPATAPVGTTAGALTDRERQQLEQIPPAIRQYIQQSLPRYRELKSATDAVVKQLAGLGELKLDELRQKLRERDAILVLGPDEMKSLSFEQVWQLDPDVRQMLRAGGTAETIKPNFAGEQQVTTAIMAVTAKGKKRPKVVFVRPGGAPLTAAPSPFQRAGIFFRAAQRLRDYNFDVAEKDMSGMWAMQNQSRGMMMPPEPEPTDEEMKDAIWVALDVRSPTGESPPDRDVGKRLAAHLDAGGSAMVLASPQAPDWADALGNWGIALKTNAVAVHAPIPPSAGQTADVIEDVQRQPYFFVLNQYGSHLITKPLRSLDTIIIANAVIQTPGAKDVTVTPLLSTPAGMKTWGETDADKMFESGEAAFDEKAGDIPGPIILAAAAEKKGAGRLIVVGGVDWAGNQAMIFPDPELAKKNMIVSRFPGNSELFANSIFWLAKMDTMIAISPSAMQVNRIEDMSKGALGFWRIGVLVVGLPLAVVLAGTMVYMRRRD